MKKRKTLFVVLSCILLLSGCNGTRYPDYPIPEDCVEIETVRTEGIEGESYQVYGVVAGFMSNTTESFYLVDGSGSILVYAPQIDKDFEVGATVKVKGTFNFYQSSSDAAVGQEIGYLGARELNATSIEVIDYNYSDFPLNSIKECRIKDIVDTDFRDNDITSSIFKVKATINVATETGYTNYYFDDLNEEDGVYVYSTNSGSDYSYLKQYDGETHYCYIAIHSMRPRDEAWRIIPISILEETSATDAEEAEFALDRLSAQFKSEYNKSITVELVKEDTKLGSEASVSYKSSSKNHTITEEGDYYYLNIDGDSLETFTVTVSLKYKKKTYKREIEIVVRDTVNYDSITCAEIQEVEEGEEVIISGIYLKYTANYSGLYLVDSTGIAVVYYASLNLDDYFEGEILTFRGTVTNDFSRDGVYDGHHRLENATLLEHDSTYHEWDKSIVSGEKTVSELYSNFDVSMVGKIYKVEALIQYYATNYSSLYEIVDPETGTYCNLYCSNASQLSWLEPYCDEEVYTTYVYIRDTRSATAGRFEIIYIDD
ncbi:MAG: hypothetical protein LUD22_00005 [Coprobacillus sp.]|nr:hypothetical protein [Coprobacillus sp.]